MSSEEQRNDAPDELRDLSKQLRPMEAPTRVEATLVAAHRRRHAARTPWLAAWRLLVPAALAALALIVLLPRPNVEERAPALTEREIATEFLPVGLGLYPGGGEFSQLIRVRLRREEMVHFGLPAFDAESAGEWVNADVAIGEDGLARAIRFVEP
jgi:hypothetical protein